MKVTLSAETMTISAALREVQMETKEHPDNRHTATIYPTTAALGTPKTARSLDQEGIEIWWPDESDSVCRNDDDICCTKEPPPEIPTPPAPSYTSGPEII